MGVTTSGRYSSMWKRVSNAVISAKDESVRAVQGLSTEVSERLSVCVCVCVRVRVRVRV